MIYVSFYVLYNKNNETFLGRSNSKSYFSDQHCQVSSPWICQRVMVAWPPPVVTTSPHQYEHECLFFKRGTIIQESGKLCNALLQQTTRHVPSVWVMIWVGHFSLFNTSQSFFLTLLCLPIWCISYTLGWCSYELNTNLSSFHIPCTSPQRSIFPLSAWNGSVWKHHKVQSFPKMEFLCNFWLLRGPF